LNGKCRNKKHLRRRIDGYTATRQIKADPALRSIPIIAVTSYALNGEEKKARAAGWIQNVIFFSYPM
jgi:CheY-like chemotaxis protein